MLQAPTNGHGRVWERDWDTLLVLWQSRPMKQGMQGKKDARGKWQLERKDEKPGCCTVS